MGIGERRRPIWYLWAGSAFVLSVILLVALIFNTFNRLWGFGGPLDDIWVILMLASIAAGVHLWQWTKRPRRSFTIMIVVNIAIVIMPYGPSDVALRNSSGLIHWKVYGQNRYHLRDADFHGLRVAIENDYTAPDYLFTVSAEGEMMVEQGLKVQAWDHFFDLYWPGRPFAHMADDVMASGKLQLSKLQQTSVMDRVRSLNKSRLRNTHSTGNRTTVYVEYSGSTSLFQARDIVHNEQLRGLLMELAKLSPVKTSLCDMIGDEALVYGGLCAPRW